MKNKSYIMLSESQIKKVIDNIIFEQRELNERGVRSKTEKKWNYKDHALALYNSLYSIEDLGISKKEISNRIIGTTVGSFVQQSANFDYLDGKIKSYYREHKLQPIIYKKFKNMDKEDFKKYCLEVIEYRYEFPEESAKKFELGNLIGDKKDEITKERATKLKKAGFDVNKLTLISQRPKYEPTPDDEEDIEQIPNDNNQVNTIKPTSKKTSKDEIRDYLLQLYKKAINSDPDLADDIKFITDYIENELVDKEMISEIRKIFK